MKTNLTAIDSVVNLRDTATAITRERYQRISSIYDRMEGLMEQRFRPWREKLWQFACGPRILEVGVGTGKNMEFWPKDCKVTAIDLTPGMLEIARQRAKRSQRQGDDLFLGDIQHLELPLPFSVLSWRPSSFAPSRIPSRYCVNLAAWSAQMGISCCWNTSVPIIPSSVR